MYVKRSTKSKAVLKHRPAKITVTADKFCNNRPFLHNRAGNFTLIGVLATVPLLLGLGMAVDVNRLSNAKAKAQHAADAAALAAVQETAMSDAELTAFARSYFMENHVDAINYDQSDIALNRTGNGGVVVSLNASLDSVFMKVGNFPKMDFGVTSEATLQNTSTENVGCVYLTDPRNTGLGMKDQSNFSSNCVIMITTPNKAIDIEDSATAEFGGICTPGSLNAPSGALTPTTKMTDCTLVVDPFSHMSPPSEMSGGCSSTARLDVLDGDSVTLSPGIHCGKVEIENNGVLELASGVHYFEGGLELDEGGTLHGSDVLLAFDKRTSSFQFNGTLDVSGLKTGDYKGFVIYHEDYSGNSNKFIIGENASFLAEGVIYLPNTRMTISTKANTLSTQSILVTDRFTFSNDASFSANIDFNSDTPLPNADLSVGLGKPRLVN